MLDIASDIGYVGGIDNAANLITEMCEAESPDLEAISVLSAHYPASALRRLGYIIEHFTNVPGVARLREANEQRGAAVSLLDPLSANIGSIDKNWLLKINREVELDV
jgi:predicted transcriptional regulator of viral defense system